MFATIQLAAQLETSALLAPDMAILRSGEKTTVFVALDGGRFESRAVTLGPEAGDDTYQILSGLKEGERIVTSGQFMLDSESQLRETIQKMARPKQSKEAAAGISAGMTRHLTNDQMMPPGTLPPAKYMCPMPEHASIHYGHSGACPICGMALVPASIAGKAPPPVLPSGRVLYYACPMPEHSDTHQDEPGQCPKCGMTLIPVR
jgi:rubrerythrin